MDNKLPNRLDNNNKVAMIIMLIIGLIIAIFFIVLMCKITNFMKKNETINQTLDTMTYTDVIFEDDNNINECKHSFTSLEYEACSEYNRKSSLVYDEKVMQLQYCTKCGVVRAYEIKDKDKK